MNQQEFLALAEQGYNRIPVTLRVLADLETPLSAYLKLAVGKYSFLFESVEGGEKWGRYSIIGLPAHTVFRAHGNAVSVETDGVAVETNSDCNPLDYVQEYISRYRVPELEGLPVFHGGLVGYFAYDCVRYVENRLADSCPPDRLGVPDILLMLVDELLVFDNLSGSILLVKLADPSEEEAFAKAQDRLEELRLKLSHEQADLPPIDLLASTTSTGSNIEQGFKSEMKQPRFEQAVDKIRQYILAGDVMQVVPSQRLSRPFTGNPVNLYRSLRYLNPSPYLYYLDFGDFQVAGSSPEILVRVSDGEVTVRPIAGTRPRGTNEAEDLALERELLADPKEIAEHLMLIDLGRNDVGRVARTGTVEVTEQMIVERYSHVMHIVSNVVGKLQPGLSSVDVLKACLPAGTLSGAPKIRAMEIIDEIEPSKRGVYGGAVGYLSWAGDMDTAIAIRTVVIKDGELLAQAGGGVVADSVPELEWQETLNKARVIFRAAAMASTGEEKEPGHA